MECYFDPPTQYQLTETPLLHLIRTNTVRLFSPDLQSPIPHYIKVDTRADTLKCILRRGDDQCAESFETFVPPDYVCSNCPSPTVLNWWTHVHSWVTKRGGSKTHLAVMFLSEAYLGDEDMSRKLSTCVEFLIPDVVVMNKCMQNTKAHDHLMRIYDSCQPFGLQNGENNFHVYFKDHDINITGHLAKDFAYLDIKRACSTIVLHGLGSYLKHKKKRADAAVEIGSVCGSSK